VLRAPHLGLLLVDGMARRIARVLLLRLGLRMMLLMNDARRPVQVMRRSLAGLMLRVMRMVLHQDSC
jgi:hypothetical protein